MQESSLANGRVGRTVAAPPPAQAVYDRAIMRRLAALAPLLFAAAALAGCGSAAPPPKDPAAAVPSSAPLYLEAVLQPQGKQRLAVAATGARLLGKPHPLAPLYRLLSFGGRTLRPAQATAIVGERVGLFLTALPQLEQGGSLQQLPELARAALSGSLFRNPATPPGATVFDLVDASRARAYIHAAGHAHAVRFEGVRLTVLASGEAATTYRGYLVIGNLLGVEHALETLRGGRSLAGAEPFQRLRSTPGGAPLLAAYLSPPASAKPSSKAAAAPAPPLARLLGTAPTSLYASLAVEQGAVRFELDRLTPSPGDPPTTSETETAAATAQLFAGLPEGTWLALALENLPDALHKAEAAAPLLEALLGLKVAARPSAAALLEALASGFGGALAPLAQPLAGVARALAAQPQALGRALAGWLGPAALFISGSSLDELAGGLVVSSRREQLSRTAVERLAAILAAAGYRVGPDPQSPVQPARTVALRGLPGGLQLAAGEGKLVAGLGADPISTAISPQAALGSSTTLHQAEVGLGEGLSVRFFLAFPQLSSVLGLLGANSNPALAPLMQRLYALSTLVVAVGRTADVLRTVGQLDLSP